MDAGRIEAINEALSPLREGLVADGADMQVDAPEEDRIVVELIFTEETCMECIMPREILEPALLSLAQDAVPSVSQLVVVDPRESQV